MSEEEIARFVAESRAAQGLPPVVDDELALDRLAGIFRAVEPDEHRARSRGRSSAA